MRIGPFYTEVTPALAKLLEYSCEVEALYQGQMIVADSPFLVYDDGTLCEKTVQNINLLPICALSCESVLKQELLTIGDHLRRDFYTEPDVLLLENWAALVYGFVFREIVTQARRFSEQLRSDHRLN